eukprot:jgi/Mesvir1/17453/Mv08727-RA.1
MASPVTDASRRMAETVPFSMGHHRHVGDARQQPVSQSYEGGRPVTSGENYGEDTRPYGYTGSHPGASGQLPQVPQGGDGVAGRRTSVGDSGRPLVPSPGHRARQGGRLAAVTTRRAGEGAGAGAATRGVPPSGTWAMEGEYDRGEWAGGIVEGEGRGPVGAHGSRRVDGFWTDRRGGRHCQGFMTLAGATARAGPRVIPAVGNRPRWPIGVR